MNDLKHASRDRLNRIVWDNRSLAQQGDYPVYNANQTVDEATRERRRRGKPL